MASFLYNKASPRRVQVIKQPCISFFLTICVYVRLMPTADHESEKEVPFEGAACLRGGIYRGFMQLRWGADCSGGVWSVFTRFYKERPQLSGPSRRAIDIHKYLHDRESESSKYLPKHPISFFPAGRLPTLYGRGEHIMHTVECTFVPPCVCLLRKYFISLNRLTSPRKM